MNGSNAGAGAGGGGLPPNTSTNNVSNLSNQEVVN